MSLSKREKVMLYILALVVIVVGGWIGIIAPLQKRAMQDEIRLENEQAKQQEIQMMLPALAGAEERLADEKGRKQAENYFYRNIQDVFVDRTVSELAQRQGASLEELSISSPTLSVLTPFEPYSYTMDSDQDAENAEDGTSPLGPAAPLYQCRAAVSGTEDACVGVISGLNSLGKSVYVSEFNMAKAPSDAEAGLFTCEITINFYFLGDD